ncbi:MAG: DUF6807 family protein [Verrucomicrobiota bacterium]|jgi:hypothetical protein
MKPRFSSAWASGGLGGSLALVLGLAWAAAAAAAGLSLSTSEEPTAGTVLWGQQKLFVYAFAPQKFKPYVKELAPLDGENILRDAPYDHLHHHALMYGIRVNGINFWEEVAGSGVQKVIRTWRPVFSEAGFGRPAQAQCEQLLHWVAPAEAFLPDTAPVALLVEHRTLLLTVNPAQHEVALQWKSKFHVGGKTNTVTLSGASYHGLGLRFRQDLDALAVHSLAGAPPDLASNRQDVSRAPWAAVSFDAPGHPVTIALAGHPANQRGDAAFFSMLTPFAYLSATQGLDKEPLIYHQGDQFELNYLVLLYPEARYPSAALRERVEAWRQTKP